MRTVPATLALLMMMSAIAWTEERPQSTHTIWRYAHPEAQVLMGVSWKNISASPMAAYLKSQIPAGTSKSQGLEFVDELDSLFISSPGRREGGDNQSPPFVMVMTGKFNLDELRKTAAGKNAVVSRYKGIEVLSEPDGKSDEPDIAIVAPHIILAADRGSLTEALDRGFSPVPVGVNNRLFQRAVEMASRNEIWMVANGLEQLAPSKMSNSPFLAELQALDAGIAVRDGVGINLDLHLDSEDAAWKLAIGVQTMLTLAAVQGGDRQQVAQILQNVHISQNETAVRLALGLDTPQIEAIVAEIKRSAGQGMAQVAAALTGEAVPPQPRAVAYTAEPEHDKNVKRVIRIYGLDEGTREIPFP